MTIIDFSVMFKMSYVGIEGDALKNMQKKQDLQHFDQSVSGSNVVFCALMSHMKAF